MKWFKDLFEGDEQAASYDGILEGLSKLVEDSVVLLCEAYRTAELASAQRLSFHHASLLSLTRHICEQADGVAVLVSKGSSQPCHPLLRSTLEAFLSILFILKEDTERRGLAYQVAHVHRQLMLYRSFDPNDERGKRFAAMRAADPIAVNMKLPQFDWQKKIANLEKMLARPEFVPINAEWQRMSGTKSKPKWHSLFNGPTTIEAIARQVNQSAMYEMLYRHWSNSVHAGDCLGNYAGSGGTTYVRPLRHPDNIQNAVDMACNFCIFAASMLHSHYGTPDDVLRFRQRYTSSLKPRLDELRGKKVIDAPWN